MSQVHCPNCGKEVSDRFKACPICGHLIAIAPAQRERERSSLKPLHLSTSLRQLIAWILGLAGAVLLLGGNLLTAALIGVVLAVFLMWPSRNSGV